MFTVCCINQWYNLYFGSNLTKNITHSDGNFSIYDYLRGRNGNCLYLKPVDDEEVINTVKVCTRKNLQIFKI